MSIRQTETNSVKLAKTVWLQIKKNKYSYFPLSKQQKNKQKNKHEMVSYTR